MHQITVTDVIAVDLFHQCSVHDSTFGGYRLWLVTMKDFDLQNTF